MMDQHLLLVAGALYSAKENNSVNSAILIRNLRDCCKRVEQSLSENDNSAQDNGSIARFKERLLLSVMLSCPCVRAAPQLASCAQVQPLISGMPVMADDSFSLVVRGLCYQKMVFPLLVYLPTEITAKLLRSCLHEPSSSGVPGLMSLLSEYSKAMLYGQSSEEYKAQMEVLPLLTQQFKVRVDGFNGEVPKNDAYVFLHLIGMLYRFSSTVVGRQNISAAQSDVFNVLDGAFTKVGTSVSKLPVQVNKEYLNTALYLLNLIESVFKKVDVATWMSWSEIDAAEPFFCSEFDVVDETIKLTIQAQVRFVASLFLQLFNDVDDKDALNTEIASTFDCDVAKKSLYRDLTKHADLKAFLEQIAIDPNYDSDTGLSFEELVTLLGSSTDEPVASAVVSQDVDKVPDKVVVLTKERKQKLIKMLLEWTDAVELFSHSEAARLFTENIDNISDRQIESLLKRYLNTARGKPLLPPWKVAIVEASHGLSAAALRSAVTSELQHGTSDWLATALFPANLTAVCNSLVASSQERGLWWACLQRPHATLRRVVQHAVTMSGMVAVTATAVLQVAVVARARAENGNLSILSSILEEYITDSSKLSDSTHRKCFIALFIALCKQCDGPGSSNTSTVTVSANHGAAQPGAPAASHEAEYPVLLNGISPTICPTTNYQTATDEASSHPMTVANTTNVPVTPANSSTNRAALTVEEVVPLLLPKLLWRSSVSDLEVPCVLLQALLQHRCPVTLGCLEPGPPSAALVVFLLSSLQHNASRLLGHPSATGQRDAPDQTAVPQPRAAAEPVTGTGLENCVKLMQCLRDCLHRLVMSLLQSEEHGRTVALLRKYLSTKNKNYFHPSIIATVQPLFKQNNPLASRIDSDADFTTQSLVMNILLNLSADSTSMLNWDPEEWTYYLFSVLRTGLPEDWIATCNILNNYFQGVDDLFVLSVLRDTLRLLCCHTPDEGGPVSRYWYTNYNSAATHYLNSHTAGMSVSTRLTFLGKVFAWWSRTHVIETEGAVRSPAGLDGDMACVLLSRVLDMIRTIIISNQSANSNGIVSTKSACPEQSDQFSSRAQENSQNGHVNDNTPIAKDASNTNLDYKQIIEDLIEPFTKYISVTNPCSSVANQINALREI